MFSLRPMLPSDREFAFRVYADSRREELAPLEWPPEQQAAFLRMQFDIRERQYRAEYSDADWSIILADGVDAGTMILRKTADGAHLADIALLSEFRRAGIGTEILDSLQKEGRKITLHVVRDNPAVRLYSRLGFTSRAGDSMYLSMEWNPQ